jgi:hypothetical protein
MADRMESTLTSPPSIRPSPVAATASPVASCTPTEVANFDQGSFSRPCSATACSARWGQVGSACDNAAMASFFSLLQNNVLNRRT